MSPSSLRVASIAGLLALAGGCADLALIEEGVCGNQVLEPGEDCDVHTDPTLGSGLGCGAPAATGACHYVCAEEAVTCPVGWDCGRDGVCRRASDQLRLGARIDDWSPASFEPLDFDGDGRVDLVGAFADGIELRLGEASGAFRVGPVVPTRPTTGDVAVGSLDGDPYGDILLPTAQGLLMWRGSPDGPPLPLACAGLDLNGADAVWPVPLGAPELAPDSVFALFAQLGEDLIAGVRVPPDEESTTYGPFAQRTRLDELGDRLAVADVDGDGTDDLAVAILGASQVSLHSIQRNVLSGEVLLGGLATSLGPTLVGVGRPRACEGCEETLAEGHVGGRALFADVEGDRDLDLLVGVTLEPSGEDVVVVARGDGAGAFGEPYRDDRFALLASPGTVTPGFPQGELRPWPLAAGDLDGDGVADYVSPHGVFFTDPETLALRQVELRDTLEPWTDALLVDVDGDETLDVAAIAHGEAFVDVLRCGSGDTDCASNDRFLGPARYPTTSGVTKLRAGHLQGSGATDLVVRESAAEGSGGSDALGVLYARHLGWPDPPIRKARFHHIEQIEIGRIQDRSPGGDAFEDLVLAVRTAAGVPAAGVLFAEGGRELTSPFRLTDNRGGDAAGVRVLTGRFADPDARWEDLVAFGLGASGASFSWWVPGAEDALVAPTTPARDLRGKLDVDFDLGCATFAAGDIDGDGRDEVVGMSGRALSGGARCGEASSTLLAVGRPDEQGEIRFDVRELALVDDPAGEGRAQIAVADLEGDGADELVIADTGGATLLRWGPSGLEEAQRVELPAGERVLDSTTLARHRGGPRRVALLLEASVVVLSAGGVVARTASGGASARPTRVRSADVDGDGLGDLLLLGPNGIDVLLAIPAPPLGG